MANFGTPISRNGLGYIPAYKLQKIPLGESFEISLETKGASVRVTLNNPGVADLVERPPSTADFLAARRQFQINGLREGFTMLEARLDPTQELADSLQVQVLASDNQTLDLIYNGTRLTWNRTPVAWFRATSGMTRNAGAQDKEDQGPIPQGVYTFLAELDPMGTATYDPKSEKLVDTREGIQNIPPGTPVSVPWGKHRVRLTPLSGGIASRGGFYLHDSDKGHTHGCIETEEAFFRMLIAYAKDPAKSKRRLTLKVAYSSPNAATEGGTKWIDPTESSNPNVNRQRMMGTSEGS
jgi:hypothetical protein